MRVTETGSARPASRATDLAVGGDDKNVGPQSHGDLRVADCGVEREVQPPAVPTLLRSDLFTTRADVARVFVLEPIAMIPNSRLPGSELSLDDGLRGVLALGLLDAEPLAHDPLPPEFDAERDQVIARWTAIAAERAQADLPGLAEVRAMFHRLDIDPTKTRPSSEALLRRVLQGKGLPRVHPVVDVCNLCSLEFQLPLGLYDRDQVHGAIHVRAGREGEGYDGIRKDRVNLAGRLLLADDLGPFGAPTSDSLRSAITSETRRLMVVVFCPVERAPGELTAALERISDRLTRFCGAQVMAVRVLQ